MSTRNNWRFDSLENGTAASPIEPISGEDSGRRVSVHIESFFLEFRQVIDKFLRTELENDSEVETVLEKTFTLFRKSMGANDWRKSVSYRKSIANFLSQSVSLHDPNRFQTRLKLFWRQHIINTAWKTLRQAESETERPYFTILSRRYQNPSLSCDNLLTNMQSDFPQQPTRQAFRVFLTKAEVRLAKGVVASVVDTVHLPTEEIVQEELAILDLTHFLDRIVAAQEMQPNTISV